MDVLDGVVVLSSLTEIAIQHFSPSDQDPLRAVLALRTLRLLRVFKVL